MGNVNCHRYRRNHVCREYWLYTDTKLEHQLKYKTNHVLNQFSMVVMVITDRC